MQEIINLCFYKEATIPYCQSIGALPFTIGRPFLKCLNDLTDEEKVLSAFKVTPEMGRKNPQYFKSMYSDVEEYSDEYIEAVFTQSPVISNGVTYYQADINSKYVNIIQGVRFTHNIPKLFSRTIHILGYCITLGYGVDDSRTIASYLQRKINQLQKDLCNKVRVVNHGVWGMDYNNPNLYFNKLGILLQPNDIVIFFDELDMRINSFKMEVYGDTLNKTHIFYSHLYNEFNKVRNKPLFLDQGHLSHHGMKRVADFIANLLQNEGVSKESAFNTDNPYISSQAINISMDNTLSEYIAFLKSLKKEDVSLTGSIVMNCNPFTKGHRYLVEQAAKQVDNLFIFVVEEDKSFFPFKDRFELVKQGTSDLKNVTVVPSGKFIISAITFPEYFVKDALNEVIVDTSKDIELFASKIALILNISKRFAGEEPFDPITRQYNQTMSDILPKYNIEFVEISKCQSDGEPISASRVRRLLKQKDWEAISNIVPETTLDYLKNEWIDR